MFLTPFDPEFRADGRIRTADQLITNQLLYQLSYIGMLSFFKKDCKIINYLVTKQGFSEINPMKSDFF